MRKGEIDLAVVVEGPDLAGLWTCAYRHDQLAAVLRDDDPQRGTSITFSDLPERDLGGLEGGSTLTRLLEEHAAQLMRPVALRVQVRSFEAVCRAVEARLGIGVLPFQAARSFAPAMRLRVLPLAEPWARRRMLLCLRSEPAPGSARRFRWWWRILRTAPQPTKKRPWTPPCSRRPARRGAPRSPARLPDRVQGLGISRGSVSANDGRRRACAASSSSRRVAGTHTAVAKRKRM